MRLGHVNLYVRDAEQSRDWYARVLELHTYHYRPGCAAFMSADLDMSHEVALMQVGPDAAGPMRGQVGLNHMAWMVESLADLAVAYRRLKDNQVRIDASSIMGFRWGSISAIRMGTGWESPASSPARNGHGRSRCSRRMWSIAAYSLDRGTAIRRWCGARKGIIGRRCGHSAFRPEVKVTAVARHQLRWA